MPDKIELADLNNKPFFDIDKSGAQKLTPGSRRKLWFYVFLETLASCLIYFNYNKLILLYPLMGPTLLGASTAALAQSINQFQERRFSESKIAKFITWGMINGCFTALWIDSLVRHVDSLLYTVLIDQLIGAPCFQLVFHILSKVWDGADLSVPATSNTSTSTFFTALKYSYFYWPFVSVAIFISPPNTMFLGNCTANLIWNIILSKLS